VSGRDGDAGHHHREPPACGGRRRPGRGGERDRAKRALEAAGAHFMNFFGRLATEDISRWRGKELPIPPHLLR
jgi:hypothetical protein